MCLVDKIDLLIDNINYPIVALVRVIFGYIDIQNINCLFNGRESIEFVPLYIMKILVYTWKNWGNSDEDCDDN